MCKDDSLIGRMGGIMEMTAVQLINLLLGSGGLLGLLIVIFRSGKIVQKIESMDKRLDKMDETLHSLDKGQSEIRIQLGKLETRVEERTFRVVQTTKEIRPDPAHLGSLNLHEEKTTRNAAASV